MSFYCGYAGFFCPSFLFYKEETPQKYSVGIAAFIELLKEVDEHSLYSSILLTDSKVAQVSAPNYSKTGSLHTAGCTIPWASVCCLNVFTL